MALDYDKNIHGQQEKSKTYFSEGQMVAFYAWMNNNENNPGPHTIIFDGVQSNLGSAYDRHTGISITPATGFYVILCTLIAQQHGWIHFESVVNSTPFEYLLTNSHDITDEQTTTGLVVLSLKQADDAFVFTQTSWSWKYFERSTISFIIQWVANSINAEYKYNKGNKRF